MALREIVLIGEPVLKTPSRAVEFFDERLHMLIDDMIETMFHADGVGLAAPQVGVLKRVCVILAPDKKTIYELINPVIISQDGTQVFSEGCLSIPNKHGEVQRPMRITVRAQDRNGKEFILEASNYLAVIMCHEIDHLDGILFTERLNTSADTKA